MHKILIVEDDLNLNAGISFNLNEEGYWTISAYNIRTAKELTQKENINLIIIDVNLPDGNGFEFCKTVKEIKDIPVIFLTACDLENDVINGYQLGAEDYVTKPFNIQIFCKKVSAILKRCEKQQMTNIFKDGNLWIDFDTMEVSKQNESINLTATEFRLLKLFVTNQKIILTKETIMDKIWDVNGDFIDEHTLSVNVSRLKRKIETKTEKYIKTVYGMGYMWISSNVPLD